MIEELQYLPRKRSKSMNGLEARNSNQERLS
jgi:hypothetical protein